jgi:hypothetical protein
VAGGLRYESPGEAAPSGVGVGVDRELVAEPVVLLDPHTGGVPTCVVGRDKDSPVERQQPGREPRVVAAPPRADVRQWAGCVVQRSVASM